MTKNRLANLKWKRIRESLLSRFPFCQVCGLSGRRLEIHHKIPYGICQSDDLPNLMVVCRGCHTVLEHRNRVNFLNHPKTEMCSCGHRFSDHKFDRLNRGSFMEKWAIICFEDVGDGWCPCYNFRGVSE